jgi:hypothetical protein
MNRIVINTGFEIYGAIMSSNSEDSVESSCDRETTGATYQLPESEVHYAFGPDKWYWIRCGAQWRL